MAFTFPAGFADANDRLGTKYNGDVKTPTNPGGMDQYGYQENLIPALRDVTSAGQGIAAFADYLNTSISPLIAEAVASATTVAAGYASTANTRAGDAAASAVQAALSANKLSGTSSSSNAIGTGAKTFVTQADKFFATGSTLTIYSDSNPSGQQMSGLVTGYSGTNLTVAIVRTIGSGTYGDWTIRVSGAAGQNGAAGWTPVFANPSRGSDVVQRVVDWTGGSGTKPATGSYVGPTGFVENIADATNLRGLAGAGGGNVNPSGSITAGHLAIFSDGSGNLITSGGAPAAVATTGAYADLSGTPTIPTTPGDIGAVAVDSPALTGTPSAPTASAGTNTTQLATLAFVIAEILARRGAANGIASLGADTKILSSQLPALAITDTFEVASQAAMLALTAERGDVAVRSDINKSYILKTEPATTLANWVELKTPTDVVLAVAGLTGTITASDLRTALSLVIGTNVQAYDADLTAIAALATTPFGRDLLTLADAAALLTAAGGLAAASKATAAQRRALTSDTVYNTPKSDADAMEFVSESVTGTKAINWSLGWNRVFNLTGNTTLGQHTNLEDGQSGIAYFIQDGTGSRTIAANTTYNKFAGGTVWTLSTAANAVDRAGYVLRLRGGVLVTEWGGLEKGIA